MFSGIIETKQPILTASVHGECKRVRIAEPKGWKVSIGESISVDGICSTVVAKAAKYFEIEYMPETLGKTTADAFGEKRIVNLERSLTYGDRIHGHFVMGHVDARIRIISIEREGRSRLVTFSLPSTLSKFIVPRGSCAINGVSLTVARKTRGRFAVALIPHTLAATNLGQLKEGEEANLECDTLARYGRLKLHANGERHKQSQ